MARRAWGWAVDARVGVRKGLRRVEPGRKAVGSRMLGPASHHWPLSHMGVVCLVSTCCGTGLDSGTAVDAPLCNADTARALIANQRAGR